jgi:hypothetical protein
MRRYCITTLVAITALITQLGAITLGQSEEEVVKDMGAPNIKAVRNGTLKYVYSSGSIEFIDGKVTSFSSELSKPSSRPTEQETIPALPKIELNERTYSLFAYGREKQPIWSDQKNSFKSFSQNIRHYGHPHSNLKTPYAGTYMMLCFADVRPRKTLDVGFEFEYKTHVPESNHARIFTVALVDLEEGAGADVSKLSNQEILKIRSKSVLAGLNFVYNENEHFDAYMKFDKGLRGTYANHFGTPLKQGLSSEKKHSLRICIDNGWGIIHLDGRRVYAQKINSEFNDLGVYIQLVGGSVNFRNMYALRPTFR